MNRYSVSIGQESLESCIGAFRRWPLRNSLWAYRVQPTVTLSPFYPVPGVQKSEAPHTHGEPGTPSNYGRGRGDL